MVPFTTEESESMKHNLKQVGKKYVFTIKNLGLEDAGLYSVDVGGINVFSTDFKGMSQLIEIRLGLRQFRSPFTGFIVVGHSCF